MPDPQPTRRRTRSPRYILGAILLLACVAVVIWQGDFSGSFASLAPGDPTQTFVFYAISLLIFLLMLTLGFMLVRLIVKLWIERSHNRAGSRISTKLVVGAIAISVMPVFFMVLFSVYVLNNTLQKWFTRPEQHELVDLTKIAKALERQTRQKAQAEAELLANLPETKAALANPLADRSWLGRFCREHGIDAASVAPAGTGATPSKTVVTFGQFPRTGDPPAVLAESGPVRVAVVIPIDIAQQRQAIQDYDREFYLLSLQRRATRSTYLLLLTLIALFIFFVASWLAYVLARQISGPIAALVRAAQEVSHGNLGYRVETHAVDELAQLVAAFNRMTGDLEANRAELEARRRFTETILECIPTGVISVDSAGNIQRMNKALGEIFPDVRPRDARLEDLFPPEDAAEVRYLMNRARRTGRSTTQLELQTGPRTRHLGVTVSAVDGRRGSGFVIVIEDTSDLLRAQKTAAWSEVARRVAHEIRNPMTPITLSAERILRRQNAGAANPAADPVIRECAETILFETASVKRLVDEFTQFSRLPAARPVLCDLNDVVSTGIAVFDGRLDGIELQVELSPGLPQVFVDPEQFRRVVVNLIDNGAEAMQDSPTKVLAIQTRPGVADNLEIVFADTGCGVTSEQKEKLFLPYFSTKGRGTGLGLAIVSHILNEHNASIRIEDNKPCGAWFTIEVPIAAPEPSSAAVQSAAAEAPAPPVSTGAASARA